MTVAELVELDYGSKLAITNYNQQQHDDCEKAIAAVGLQGFENRMLDTLSGGQMQRVLFARVLLQDRPVILLDEPFNAIDRKTVEDLTEAFCWHKDRRTVVMVSHDLIMFVNTA